MNYSVSELGGFAGSALAELTGRADIGRQKDEEAKKKAEAEAAKNKSGQNVPPVSAAEGFVNALGAGLIRIKNDLEKLWNGLTGDGFNTNDELKQMEEGKKQAIAAALGEWDKMKTEDMSQDILSNFNADSREVTDAKLQAMRDAKLDTTQIEKQVAVLRQQDAAYKAQLKADSLAQQSAGKETYGYAHSTPGNMEVEPSVESPRGNQKMVSASFLDNLLGTANAAENEGSYVKLKEGGSAGYAQALSNQAINESIKKGDGYGEKYMHEANVQGYADALNNSAISESIRNNDGYLSKNLAGIKEATDNIKNIVSQYSDLNERTIQMSKYLRDNSQGIYNDYISQGYSAQDAQGMTLAYMAQQYVENSNIKYGTEPDHSPGNFYNYTAGMDNSEKITFPQREIQWKNKDPLGNYSGNGGQPALDCSAFVGLSLYTSGIDSGVTNVKSPILKGLNLDGNSRNAGVGNIVDDKYDIFESASDGSLKVGDIGYWISGPTERPNGHIVIVSSVSNGHATSHYHSSPIDYGNTYDDNNKGLQNSLFTQPRRSTQPIRYLRLKEGALKW